MRKNCNFLQILQTIYFYIPSLLYSSINFKSSFITTFSKFDRKLDVKHFSLSLFSKSLGACNAPPLQSERGKEEGDQGESSRHTLDQLQNANSPISGSLFDRFNRLHTLVPSSLRTERKERQKSVISLSLSPSLSRSLSRGALSPWR